jgi:O-antigen/teichoic acid export membrane protein
MPHARRIVQNIFSNWVALAITTLVGFFLSPYVVHHLGNVTYGVWVLTLSFVSYMNLLDLGLRNAVSRYVTAGAAQGNHGESSEAISAALWIRLWISLAIIAAGLVLSVVFHHLFVIPADLQREARLAILVTCVSVAISLWSGVFGSVLAAFHRFDLISAVSILQTCFRAAGMVWLLKSGHTILALAIWDLCTSLVANGANTVLAFRVFPEMKIALGRPSSVILRKLWGYSFYVFLIHISVQVAYYSDNLVIGAFLSPAAVTVYAIGGMLIGYARTIISSMTATFTPLASSYDAVGNYDNLRRLVIQGTRAALVVALPIEAALFFRGRTFIHLWMGEQYAEQSGTVMRILLLSVLVASANTTSVGIVFGMAKHKRIAFWALGEAAANLTLSIILVRRMGINGVAWGSAIPSLFCELILWPAYVSKLLTMSVRTYLWQTWIRTTIAVIPFALACEAAEHFWHAPNLLVFFLQIAVMLPLVPLSLALMFREEVGQQWRRWKIRRRDAGRLNQEYQPSTTPVG